jgi:predicted RecB family nuclease
LSDVEVPEEEDVEHFQVGNSLHDAAEAVLKKDGVESKSKSELEDLLKEEERKLDYNYDDRNQVETCLNFAAKFIDGYVDSVFTVEDRMEMTQNGIDFVGYADLIGDVEGKSDTIVDWKTGKENDEWKERIQGGMYVKMFHEEFGRWPESIQFVYLNEGTRSVHSRVVDGEVMWNDHQNNYWDEIKGYISDISNDAYTGEFEAKPDESKCHFCSFKYACTEGSRGAETAKPQHFQVEPLL